MNRLDIARNAAARISKSAMRALSTGSSSRPFGPTPICARAVFDKLGPPPEPSPMPEIISRSWPSRYLATSQPLFSPPTRLFFGTFTSSKKVSQNGEEPEMRRIGRVETPGVAMSNKRKEMPPCFVERSVRTRQKIQSALSA